MEPVAIICIKSANIAPQEIIVVSQNILCDCCRRGRTADTKSKRYLIPGTSSNQGLALLAESFLHFNSDTHAAAAKGEKGQRARKVNCHPSDSCLATLSQSFELKYWGVASCYCFKLFLTSSLSAECQYLALLSLNVAAEAVNTHSTTGVAHCPSEKRGLQPQLSAEQPNEESIASSLVNNRSSPLSWECPMAMTVWIPSGSLMSISRWSLALSNHPHQTERSQNWHIKANPQPDLQYLWNSAITKWTDHAQTKRAWDPHFLSFLTVCLQRDSYLFASHPATFWRTTSHIHTPAERERVKVASPQ